jgi:hypothetical protein
MEGYESPNIQKEQHPKSRHFLQRRLCPHHAEALQLLAGCVLPGKIDRELLSLTMTTMHPSEDGRRFWKGSKQSGAELLSSS